MQGARFYLFICELENISTGFLQRGMRYFRCLLWW